MDPPKEKVQEPVEKKEEQKNENIGNKSEKQAKEDKTYIKSKKKWKQFNMDQSIIQALRQQNKNKPTKVQQEALQVALNPDRKKFNLLLRAINGSGKTLAFLLPIICSLQPGLKIVEDKFARGKTMANEVYRPQAIIIIQNFLLQSQLNEYLSYFRDYGENNNIDKLKFKVGVLNQQGHDFGDIIICMTKSFLNRHARGNMKLDQCKYVAIDEIDDIYNFDKDSLGQLLKIVKGERPNIIACSATMQKHFLKFYQEIDPDFMKLNINADLQKQTGQKITLQGVKNFSHLIKCAPDSKVQIYEYILKDIFKQLYGGNQVHKKPQVFIFFNSVDDIYEFDKKFQALSTDFTTDQSTYLQSVTRAAIAAKVYKDGKKVDLPHAQKQLIINKFKHSQTNVLLCTNIMARGIDIRNATFVINVTAPKKSDRQNDIDVDIYLHRVGRTGRHNDKGVALTLGTEEEISKLTEGAKKIHKIEMINSDNMKEVTQEVFKCIQSNA